MKIPKGLSSLLSAVVEWERGRESLGGRELRDGIGDGVRTYVPTNLTAERITLLRPPPDPLTDCCEPLVRLKQTISNEPLTSGLVIKPTRASLRDDIRGGVSGASRIASVAAMLPLGETLFLIKGSWLNCQRR